MESGCSNSLSPGERVKEVEAKIEEFLDKDNEAQILAARQWVDRISTSLMQDYNAMMLDEEYWLEAIDPLHRYGSNLLSYVKAWRRSKSSNTFFDWLDNGEGKGKKFKDTVRWSRLDEERVSYLQEPVEREGFEVIVNNGKLYYKKSGDPVETKSKEQWMYVLSPCRELFVGKKKKGSFHHSTFLAGAPVMAAGTIQASNGEIKELKSRSGHYKPTEENLLRLTGFLEEEGVDLTSIILS